MCNESYTEMLRVLSKDYYQNHIGFSEYRERRKVVLDKVDAEYNGWHTNSEMTNETEASLLSKAIGLFKNIDDKK